jgi:hypothetical protein
MHNAGVRNRGLAPDVVTVRGPRRQEDEAIARGRMNITVTVMIP